MIMIRDNSAQTINTLTTARATMQEGQLTLTTGGRYRFIEFSEGETALIMAAIKRAEEKATEELKEKDYAH